MTRKELLAALRAAAEGHGLPFRTGLTYRINTEMDNMSEAWAEPPALIRKQGRMEGFKLYKITLRIIHVPQDTDDSEQIFDTMEAKLTAILDTLSRQDDVVEIAAVEYSTEEGTLTNRREISVKSVFTIQTRF